VAVCTDLRKNDSRHHTIIINEKTYTEIQL